MSSNPILHFKADIHLWNPPLVEAWIEIRWRLIPEEQPEFMRDEGFPFALGTFYNNVREKFGFRKDLPASKAPPNMLPHVVRHQFRIDEDSWPVLQLGPGVATVNFTSPYSWPEFKNTALYLRSKLVEAYADFMLETQSISLKYRNAEPFSHGSDSALDFLRQKLNTDIELPLHIPGQLGIASHSVNTNLEISFELKEPQGRGSIQIVTAVKQDQEDLEKPEFILFELRVISSDHEAPDITSEGDFERWLSSAHDVIHEWFFTLVEGELRQKYEKQGD